MPQLNKFDGRDVRRTTISVTNAGDGLSQSMKIEPREMHIGEKVFVVLECEVAKLRFVPIDDGDDLAREHILRAGVGTIVDEDLVKQVIDEARARIIKAREDEKGIQQIEGIEDDPLHVMTPEQLNAAHDLGSHVDHPRSDCLKCQAPKRGGKAPVEKVNGAKAPATTPRKQTGKKSTGRKPASSKADPTKSS